LGFDILSMLSIYPGIFGYMVEYMELGEGVDSKENSKLCDSRLAIEIAVGT
jgi:hypothetical protein